MPSVQELLQVLEADKSPFTSLLEGFAGGYANAQQNRIENAKRLMEIDKMRQEQELARQEQQRRIAEDLRIRTERGITSDLKAQGGIPSVTPQQKQKKVIESDPKTGLYSEKITYETDDTTPKETFTPEQYAYSMKPDGTPEELKVIQDRLRGLFPDGRIPKDYKVDSGARNERNVIQQTNQIRSQYIKDSNEFQGYSRKMQTVIDSAKNPTAAGDLSLIYAYMKMLDPTSVVREGEFATAQNTGSIPQAIVAKYNKVVSGERLSDDIRNDFVKRARMIYKGQAERQAQLKREYKNISLQSGVDPARTIIDYEIKFPDEVGDANPPPATGGGATTPKQSGGWKYLGPKK